MRSFALDLLTGELTLFLVAKDRACCVHVRDGEDSFVVGTITLQDGHVLSWELCRICVALHTLMPD